MRKIGAALVATTLLMSGALAADVPAATPLPAGKPAGVKPAALEMGGVLLVGTLVGIAAIIAIVASTTQGSSTSGTGS